MNRNLSSKVGLDFRAIHVKSQNTDDRTLVSCPTYECHEIEMSSEKHINTSKYVSLIYTSICTSIRTVDNYFKIKL